MRNSLFVVSSRLERREEMISEAEALSMEMVWSQGIDKKDWKKKDYKQVSNVFRTGATERRQTGAEGDIWMIMITSFPVWLQIGFTLGDAHISADTDQDKYKENHIIVKLLKITGKNSKQPVNKIIQRATLNLMTANFSDTTKATGNATKSLKWQKKCFNIKSRNSFYS